MGLTLNVQEAVGDINKYDQETQTRLMSTLATVAQLMDRHQKATLLKKVKDRTPILETSISAAKKGRYTWFIGPSDKVKYAWWIEAGGRFGFTGYHYVRDSVNRYRREFIARIKKDIERPV